MISKDRVKPNWPNIFRANRGFSLDIDAVLLSVVHGDGTAGYVPYDRGDELIVDRFA
jgi:hypothetical protein